MRECPTGMNTITGSSPLRLDNSSGARLFTLIVGVWLFISAFVWPHTTAQMTNTWICGLIAVMFAGIAVRFPQARFVNTVLAIWLFISAFALPTESNATTWNNVVVAIALFIASLVPSERTARTIHRTA